MFELTDVYYINLILIILPSCCFLFKIFPMFKTVINKTKIYMFNQAFAHNDVSLIKLYILIVSGYSEIVSKHVSA